MPELLLMGAIVFGCLFSALLTGLIINPLRALNIRQVVREDGPETHLKKTGTPSMGGIAFLTALVIVFAPTVGIGGLSSSRAFYILGFVLAMALVGFLDDYQKIRRGGAYGFGARLRIVVEIALALVLAWELSMDGVVPVEPGLGFSFIPAAGWLWLVFAAFVLVGTANAVNLTDGLDGLAAGLTALCALALGVACIVTDQLDLALLAFAVAGVSLGFLWFNAHPARIFMGDVGSLGLGAALGGIAIAARIEVVLLITGFIFVAETLSVIGQVINFKATGRRIFKMAPLHHHFELSGWAEQTVVSRFWIVGACLAVVGVLIAVAGAVR